MLSRLFIAVAFAWPIASAAQPATPVGQPADPAASVPAIRYDSAFRGYRRYAETKLGSWREINADVLNAAPSTDATPGPSTGRPPPAEVNVRKPDAHRH